MDASLDTQEAEGVILAILVDRLGGTVTITQEEAESMRRSPRVLTAHRSPERFEWTIELQPEG